MNKTIKEQSEPTRTQPAQWKTCAKWAVQAWVISGIYLFWTGHVPFASRLGLGFFTLGPVAAAAVFGGALVLAERVTASILARSASAPSTTFAILVASWSTLLVIADMIGVFLTARWAFHALA